MMAWFGVQEWPWEFAVVITRQWALERATHCWLADRPPAAEAWLRVARGVQTDDPDAFELGGES